MLRIVGDETKYGNQIVSPPIPVKPDRDYVFRVPLKLEEGRALLKVTGPDPNATQQQALAASVIDLVEGVPPADQALKRIELPFVSGNHTEVRLVLANNASAPVLPVARMGTIELYELGPSAYQWTRIPRFVIRTLQRFLSHGMDAAADNLRNRCASAGQSPPYCFVVTERAALLPDRAISAAYGTALCDCASLLLHDVRRRISLDDVWVS